MEEKNKVKQEKSSWNLSQAIIEEIAGLLLQCDRHYVKHNFFGAFIRLKAVKGRICHYLNEEESKEFEKLEDKILINSANAGSNLKGFAKQTEEHKKNSILLWKNVDVYNNLLMNVLKKYGLLIPAKEDKTEMTA